MAKHKLNAQSLKKAPAGAYGDGGNLWCLKDSPDVGRFVFRYMLRDTSHSMGLGSMSVFTLTEARDEADRLRKLLKKGIDPLTARREEIAQRKLDEAKTKTFKECALEYVGGKKAEWRNARHADQWSNSLKQWVYPIIGDVPVQLVDTALVLRVLEQKVDGVRFWEARSETASRTRGRIENILGWAQTRGYRDAETQNPARWKAHLANTLPYLTKAKAVKHFDALPYRELPNFVNALKTQPGMAARALEYVILVGARAGEALGLTWQKVNFDAKLVVIPGIEMKGGREHRVPIVGRALEILEELYGNGKSANALVFPGRGNVQLRDATLRLVIKKLGYQDKTTTHGFRSTFSDWVTEETNFAKDAAELQLAHPVGGTVEMSYRRGNLLRKRFELMAAWDAFAYSVPDRVRLAG